MVFSAEEVGAEFKLRDWLRGVTTPSPADPAMWAVRRVKGHLPLGKELVALGLPAQIIQTRLS